MAEERFYLLIHRTTRKSTKTMYHYG